MPELISLVTPKTNWVADNFYNADDYNRVETNTILIANYYIGLGYPISLSTTITNRDKASYDLVSSVNRLESNIDEIRAKLITPPNYQTKRIWDYTSTFDYKDANRWESNLNLLNLWGLNIQKSFRYCGTFSSGQEIIL